MENNMFCFQCEQTAGCGRVYRQSRCLRQTGRYCTASGSTDRGAQSVLPVRQREMYRGLPLIKSLSRDYLQLLQM